MTDLIERLAALVRVPTFAPDGDERALATMLAGQLRAHRPDALVVEEVSRDGDGPGAYVFARWGTPRLLLNAHIDTVPPNTGWTGDPLVLRSMGERLVGLGAADTKGAVAAILHALDEFASAGKRPRDLGILFSGDEEQGGACMRAFLASPHAGGIVRAIVCEPTGNRVGVRHRGIAAFEVRVAGEGGHSSRADELPKPIVALAQVAVRLDAFARARRSDGPEGFRGLCVNVAKMSGGVAFNVVPDDATLSVSLRPWPGADVAALRTEVESVVRDACPEATIRWVLDNAPFATRELVSFEPFLGERARTPIDLAFWTEAAMLSEAGVDAVVFGPGSISAAHAPDEFLTRAELHEAVATFAHAIRVQEQHGAG